MAITFQNQINRGVAAFKLQEPTKIKSWIKKIAVQEGMKLGQINFVFTTDAEILKTNVQYLNHDTYTDIITFDYCEGKIINGDIIISVERVRENALTFGVKFPEELRRVMIHGILHLCGYKDKSKKEAALIREKENVALKKY